MPFSPRVDAIPKALSDGTSYALDVGFDAEAPDPVPAKRAPE